MTVTITQTKTEVTIIRALPTALMPPGVSDCVGPNAVVEREFTVVMAVVL